jgi:hypothetical protein
MTAVFIGTDEIRTKKSGDEHKKYEGVKRMRKRRDSREMREKKTSR